MSKSVKEQIHEMIEQINDETVLHILMEDVAVYARTKDVTDELSDAQLAELDEALHEAERQEGILWNDFKQEMKEWKEK